MKVPIEEEDAHLPHRLMAAPFQVTWEIPQDEDDIPLAQYLPLPPKIAKKIPRKPRAWKEVAPTFIVIGGT